MAARVSCAPSRICRSNTLRGSSSRARRRLYRIVGSEAAAPGGSGTARTLIAVGRNFSHIASLTTDPPRRSRAFDRAIGAFRAGLARAPANVTAWLMLAEAWHETGKDDAAARAREMSMRVEPLAPEYALPRLRLAAALVDRLGAAGRRAVRDQIGTAVRNRRTSAGLERLLREAPALDLIRAGG